MNREWHVWDKILTLDNCIKAVMEEASTHRCRLNGFGEVLRSDPIRWAYYVRNRIGDGLELGGFTEFDVMENGKLRHVQCYSPEDAMCVRACVLQMEPRAYARLSPRSYCPVPGRGGLKLARDLRKVLRRLHNECRIHNKYHPNKKTQWKPWVGEFDERHYYASIKYNVMMRSMDRIFGEPEILNLVRVFLGGRDGLPIGAGYSSMVANMVLSPLDWMVIGHPGVYGYARHLDNAVYVTRSKKVAGDVRKRVEEWNHENGLVAHEWAKYPAGHHAIERGGWRIDKDRILPSTKVSLHLDRLMSKSVGELTSKEMLSLASLYGYVKNSQSMSLRRKWRHGKYDMIFKLIGISEKYANDGKTLITGVN